MHNKDFEQFDEYQNFAVGTAIYPDQWNNPYYPALGLAGEAGECCEKVKKIMRDKNGEWTPNDREAIMLELGDVLWYVSNLADEFGIDLSEVVEANIEKLKSRKDRGVLKGSGDSR